MLQKERHNQILAKLNLEGQVVVRNLAKDFQVTEDCIRKDLTILEKEKKLKRVHGGATLIRKNVHIMNSNERLDLRLPEKKIIAQKAVNLIEPGSMIFLGISTVNLEIAKLIYQRDLKITVVTNMIDIMQIFRQDCLTRLIFLGGDYNQSRDGFLGTITIDQIEKYKFDIAFLGVVGIDLHNDKVTTYEINDGLTKKAVIHSSKKSYMVAESVKLELDGNFVFASVSDFTGYICEKELTDNQKEFVFNYGIEIL